MNTIVLCVLIIFGFIFSIPLVAIWSEHRRKMMEMSLRLKQGADQSVIAELQDLRRQIGELRDTTTQYDMSFDTALQRIESRMGHLEGRVRTLEQNADISQNVR